MADFSFFNDDALSILIKHHLSQRNGNDAVDDDTLLCLSKLSILRSIRDQTENHSVPCEILESLILIANFDRRRGVPPSDAMREAFCAVAVHVTLRYLPLSRARYFDAVQRVWGLKIKDLEESGSSDLLSPGLDRWRNEIEEALWDKVTSQKLSGINTLCEALLRIRIYLEEAFRSIKLALRELARPEPDGVASESVPSEGNEIPRADSQTRDKVCPSLGQPKGVVVAGLDENRLSCSQNGTQSTSELEENKLLQHPLKSRAAALLEEVTDSLSEEVDEVETVSSDTTTKTLHAKAVLEDSEKDRGGPTNHFAEPSQTKEENEAFVRPENELLEEVTDSLSEEVDEVETVSSDMTTKTLHAKTILEDSEKDRGGPTNHSAEPSQAKEGNEAFVRPENVRKISIMDRNDTAHTVEWVDSIDGSAGGTNETKYVLEKSEPLKKVRRKVRWTEEEERALTEGVREYGTHWKIILESYREILSKRTQVDLKDKWRNMTAR